MERHDILSWLGNGVSLSAIISTIFGWLPAFAAFVAVLWYAIQIYESETTRKLLSRRRQRRLAKLKAEVLWLETTLRHDSQED